MALSDKNIVIIPSIGASTGTNPRILFTGGDVTSSATIALSVLNSGNQGTLSFSGNNGQLFSIVDSMSGTIFSVNDISGIPSIEVLDTGLVKLAEYNGVVALGTSTAVSGYELSVFGGTSLNGNNQITGVTTVTNTTQATATATGALQIAGGASIAGNLWVGGTINANIQGTISTATNANNVATVAQTANAVYYPAFVDSNNAASAYELLYTTSSFSVNPSTGNVGLGIAADSAKLRLYSIGSTTTFTLANDQNVNQIRSTDGRLGLYHNVGGTMTEGLSLIASGNVGIGTSTPASKLTVTGPGSSPYNIAEFTNGSFSGVTIKSSTSGYTNMRVSDGGGRNITITSQPTELTTSDNYLAAIAEGIGSGVSLVTARNADSNHITLRARGDIALYTNTGNPNLLERMRVTSTGNVGIGNAAPASKLTIQDSPTVNNASTLEINPTWNVTTNTFTAIRANVTDTTSSSTSLLMDLQVGGVSRFNVSKSGVLQINSGSTFTWSSAESLLINSPAGYQRVLAYSFYASGYGAGIGDTGVAGAGGLALSSVSSINWSSSTINAGTRDLFLRRDDANILAQRNGVNAQTFRVYNTFTDAVNYERGIIGWTGNALLIGTENSGTGVIRNTSLVGGSVIVTTNTNASSTITGALQVAGGVGIQGDLYARNIVSNGSQVLTTSSVITATPFQTILVDSVTQQFDGYRAVFDLRVDQQYINSIVDSKDAEVVLNGEQLTPYVDEIRWPWHTPYDSYKGFRIVNGITTSTSVQLIIYNAPYIGDSASVTIRTQSTTRKKRKYPFSPATIALGD